jgi:hypothetical protein
MDELRYRQYSTTEIAYAMSKYTCVLKIICPVGTIDTAQPELPIAGKEIMVLLATRNCSGIQYFDIPDGYYAYIIGFSRYEELQIPTSVGPVKITSGGCLSKEETHALSSLACFAIPYYQVPEEGDPRFTCQLGDYNMSKVVDHLAKYDKVKIKHTEHEFRDDDRDLIWVKDYPLEYNYAVEDLIPSEGLGKHLVNLLNEVELDEAYQFLLTKSSADFVEKVKNNHDKIKKCAAEISATGSSAQKTVEQDVIGIIYHLGHLYKTGVLTVDTSSGTINVFDLIK